MKRKRSTQNTTKKRTFFLVEALIAIALLLVVTIAIFSVERQMATEVKRASLLLQKVTAYDRALTLLIEKLSVNEIPFQTIEKQKEMQVDLDYSDWNALYTFHIAKSAPETAPRFFLVETAIQVVHPLLPKKDSDEESEKESKGLIFTFCLSKRLGQVGAPP